MGEINYKKKFQNVNSRVATKPVIAEKSGI